MLQIGDKVKIINEKESRYKDTGYILEFSETNTFPVLVEFQKGYTDCFKEEDLEIIAEQQNKKINNEGEKKMRILEIPVKFEKGDTFYTIKQVKEEKICHVCEGKKTIIYNGKDMRCPECMGQGKFVSNKQIQVVCEEPFKVNSIKITISSNKASVKYKGRCGFNTMSRIEENLFETKEEAQKRCDDLNRERKYITLEEINIQDSFKENKPSIEKITERLNYYKEKGQFEKDIVVDKYNVLKDGYITYLICKMLDKDCIKVIVE